MFQKRGMGVSGQSRKRQNDVIKDKIGLRVFAETALISIMLA